MFKINTVCKSLRLFRLFS